MYQEREDIFDNYGFHFLEDVEEPFIQLFAVGRELRHSSKYHLDNRDRSPAYLFQYTLGGSGMVEIEGQERLVEAGEAFFLKMPGDSSYYFDEARNQAPWDILFIMFGCHGAEKYCRLIESRLGQIFALPVYHEAIQMLFELHAMAKAGQAQNPFLISSRAFAFLCLLCTVPPSGAQRDSSLSARAKNYIRTNYGQSIGIADAAAFLKVSQSHLSREFYKETGMRPIDYLIRVRLDRAVDLLTSTERKVEEIGRECGFSTANYFGKVFKKHMGMAPAQFREYIRREGYSKMQI